MRVDAILSGIDPTDHLGDTSSAPEIDLPVGAMLPSITSASIQYRGSVGFAYSLNQILRRW
jgi:hypothetical protein